MQALFRRLYGSLGEIELLMVVLVCFEYCFCQTSVCMRKLELFDVLEDELREYMCCSFALMNLELLISFWLCGNAVSAQKSVCMMNLEFF